MFDEQTETEQQKLRVTLPDGKTIYVIYQKRTAPPPTPPTYSVAFCELEDCLDHCHCHTQRKNHEESRREKGIPVSSDNGYILRKDLRGKFVLQMFFASADDYPAINRAGALKFDTLEEAVDHYYEKGYFSEYGLLIQASPVTPDPEESRS